MGDIQGSGESGEKPVHRVSVKGFAIGVHEVSAGEYLRFVRAANRHQPAWLEQGSKYNIHTGTDDYYKKLGNALTNENHPIIGVSWQDATAYAQWLSEQTGKRYRLPTEAEWEYAARAGTESKYWWGNDLGKNNANCYECSDSWEYTAPVNSFAANAFGLYNTAGNAWEWTCSEYTKKYGSGEEKRCSSKNHANGRRVLRGGSWDGYPRGMRAAFRRDWWPAYRFYYIGFRLARTL
ncbi:MAG: formylglycine-generating enzyme family protein [Gammaproteobacteria bacterium]|nr:formylglycine-generating enzyme family protein [Gammaproteobacteria bacterium]